MKKILTILFCVAAIVAHSQITDTATLRTRINADIITNGSRAITAAQLNAILDGFLNVMPATVGNRVKYTDTASMILNLLRKSDTANMLINLLRKTDTSTMLLHYERNGFGVKYIDTVSMLSNLLRKTDTANMLINYIRSGFAVKYIDTSTMLNNLLRKSDTANLLLPYMRKTNNLSDVSSLTSARYNLNVVGITTGVDSAFILAGELIDKILVYDPATISISIGTALNIRDISPRFAITAGTRSVVCINKYFTNNTWIYFNGVTSSTIIKLYKQ